MAYVYNHYNKETGEIFYIGIGSDKKGYYTRSINFKARSTYWRNYTSQISFGVNISHDNIVFEEAQSIEKYLISFYGRRIEGNGILVNITEGGDGCLGRKMSQEHKDKLSAASKIRSKGNKYNVGKKRTDDAKMKMRNAKIGKVASDETKKKMSEARLGKAKKQPKMGPRPEEYKQMMREINKGLGLGRKLTDEHRENIAKGMRLYKENQKLLCLKTS